MIKAVHNISFDIQKGEIIGLLGPNGAGKTTTIKMICGLINPDGGDIQILGKDALDKRAKTNQYISAVLEGNRNLYRSEEHTSELQSRGDLVCRLRLE